MVSEFSEPNAEEARLRELTKRLEEQAAREERVYRSLREGSLLLRRLVPSLVTVVRFLLLASGLVAAGVGMYAHFIAPLGSVAPPLRSLLLVGVGVVLLAFGAALREART